MSGETQPEISADHTIPDLASADEELSDVELEEDRSSSLSDIEDKDAEQEHEDDAEASDDLSNPSEDDDSEAETERLAQSPHKSRAQLNVVLNAQNGSEPYERSSSKLHKQVIADGAEEDEDDVLSDEDVSIHNDSPKSSFHDELDLDHDSATGSPSLEHPSGEGNRALSISEIDSRKRKRSIMGSGGLDDDFSEPLPKRMGSVIKKGDDYAIDDELPVEEDISNPISGNMSGEEGDGQQEEPPVDMTGTIPLDDETAETTDVPVSPKKRGRKKKLVVENGINIEDESDSVQNGALKDGEDDARNGEEDHAENEGDDEVDVLSKTDEEREWISDSYSLMMCSGSNINQNSGKEIERT